MNKSLLAIIIGLILIIVGLIFWDNTKITFFGLDLFLGLIFIVYGIYLYVKNKEIKK